MEIMDPGLWSMVGFGMAVVVGGLLMAAISFFSMKETSFEDVVAEQRRKKELEDKERSRLSKQKREFFKKKFEIKKKKGNTENGKPVIEQTTVHPVQSIPTTVAADEQKKPKKEKPTKKVKATTPVSDPPAKQVAKLEQSSAPVKEKQPKPEPKAKKVEPVIKPTVADNVQSKPAVKSSKKSAEPAKETKVEEPRKPRQHKVSFSEDVKSVDSGNQEQKSKKKKGRKQQEEHPIIQAVSSADIDDSTIYYLVELLNQRLQSASGDWATAGNDVSKQQYAELQRKYESKSVEMQNAVSQSKMQSQKIQQLNQALQEAKLQQKSEVQKSDEELLKTRKAFDEYQARTKTQMEEDKKMITIMQEKLKSVNSSGDALQKMKEENDILKMTIQANASQVAEKDRLAHEVSACQAKLKENEQIRVEMERKIAEYSGTYQDQAQLEQSYTKRLEDMAAKLKATEGKYGALESEFQEAQTHLQSTQAKSSQLISQVVLLTEQNDQRSALESEYGSLAETKQALEDRLTAMEANEQSTADEFARLQSQNNQLNLKATSLTEQLNKATEEVNKYKGRSDEVTNVTKQLKEKEGALSELQKRFDDLTEQSQKAASQVEKLDKKNNELRERNWKAMEAVAAAEKVAREKCSAAKDERDTAVLDTENQVKKSLSKSFPSVKVEGKDFECWLSNFLVKASESVVVTEVVDNEDKLQDLKQQLSEAKGKADKVDKYQSQVGALEKSLSAALQRNKETEEMINKQKQEIKGKSEEVLQFKEILKNTEGILDQLQSSVEKSEKDKQEQAAMWESKKQEEVSKLEKQLSKSNKELKEQTEMLVNMEKERDNLKECVAQRESELDTCLRKCGELETSLSSEKVNDTQELCESGTDSRDTSSPIPLSLKDADIDINKAELTEDDHGFLIIEHDESNASTSHEDQSRDSSVQENGHIDEIAKLKERLEKEKTLTKNLGAAAGKLQNVLKQTQEQLGKEREKNKELMQKKKEGSSSSSSSSSESDLD
uniref:ribosome-binding protein 1 isoform X3 n=1 Tax=Ciona intestinalis TaxID=7719 RepID=UPI0002B8E4B8|nr:ribosome-binding protein 1 isoform X3 [Ciona intestinalis]|eukprot:XP_002128512.2 ribosome-binding protein 1 isoform X3 [Ciona intestinalis]